MLAGDLATTPLPQVLRQLAAGTATGGLHVAHSAGGTAVVYLRGGQVQAVRLPGSVPRLGARLVTAGRLGPEALAHAEEVQSADGQERRLEDVLVQLGHVAGSDVDAVLRERLLTGMDGLLGWTTGSWQFRDDERTDGWTCPTDVDVLLAEAVERQRAWRDIELVVPGADAVPLLSTTDRAEAELAISSEAWALLCQVDGVRTVAELADGCGFTLFEAGTVLLGLLRAGLLEVADAASAAPPGGSVATRLLAAFAPGTTEGPAETRSADEVIARMSEALAALHRPVIDEALFAVRPRAASQPCLPATEADPPDEQSAAERAVPVLDVSVPVLDVSESLPQIAYPDHHVALSEDGLDQWTLARDAFAELSAAARGEPDVRAEQPSSVGGSGGGDLRDDAATSPRTGDRPSELPGAERVEGAGTEGYPQREYGDDTDTAALLRELSSLGLDDGPSTGSPARPPAPRPAGDAHAAKRKKGLFGR